MRSGSVLWHVSVAWVRRASSVMQHHPLSCTPCVQGERGSSVIPSLPQSSPALLLVGIVRAAIVMFILCHLVFTLWSKSSARFGVATKEQMKRVEIAAGARETLKYCGLFKLFRMGREVYLWVCLNTQSKVLRVVYVRVCFFKLYCCVGFAGVFGIFLFVRRCWKSHDASAYRKTCRECSRACSKLCKQRP